LLGQATPEKQKKKALTFFFFLSFLWHFLLISSPRTYNGKQLHDAKSNDFF
jgi:hypothetical protein